MKIKQKEKHTENEYSSNYIRNTFLNDFMKRSLKRAALTISLYWLTTLTITPLLMVLVAAGLQAQGRRFLPRPIAAGSGDKWIFLAGGRIDSIRQDSGVIRLHKKSRIFPKGSLAELRKYFLEQETVLWLRDREGRELGAFRCSRLELARSRRGDLDVLLYGRFELKPSLSSSLLSVGYEAGIYQQSTGYLAPGQGRQKSHHQSLRSIRHPKDNKEMLLIKKDIVVYGQNLDPSLPHFNPYFDDRNPAHAVRIQAFYMDKHEVTNDEYLYFCQRSGHSLPAGWRDRGSYPVGKKTHPFHLANYSDATTYARWANKRLPTELEWEMAARGGLSYWMNGKESSVHNRPPIYPTGNRFDPLICNTLESSRKGTLSVYTLKDESPYGIVGLCGNAREWTSSWYGPYRGHHWSRKAVNGKVFKVIRGGSFAENKDFARTDHRDYGGLPGLQLDHSAGFRLVIPARYSDTLYIQ